MGNLLLIIARMINDYFSKLFYFRGKIQNILFENDYETARNTVKDSAAYYMGGKANKAI